MRLIVFSADPANVSRLKSAGGQLTRVSFAQGNGVHVTQRERLDALLLTPFEAEHFGVSPPSTLGVAKVERTNNEVRAKGLPMFIVTGVLMQHARPRDWRHELHEFLRAGVAAAIEHNAHNDRRIVNIGVLAEDLQVERLDVEVVMQELLLLDTKLGTTAA